VKQVDITSETGRHCRCSIDKKYDDDEAAADGGGCHGDGCHGDSSVMGCGTSQTSVRAARVHINGQSNPHVCPNLRRVS